MLGVGRRPLRRWANRDEWPPGRIFRGRSRLVRLSAVPENLGASKKPHSSRRRCLMTAIIHKPIHIINLSPREGPTQRPLHRGAAGIAGPFLSAWKEIPLRKLASHQAVTSTSGRSGSKPQQVPPKARPWRRRIPQHSDWRVRRASAGGGGETDAPRSNDQND